MTMNSFFSEVYAALTESNLSVKLQLIQALKFFASEIDHSQPVVMKLIPGRPARPELVLPKNLISRKFSTLEGRAAMIHAIAHIEFNAINLALDAAYRFRHCPDLYYQDWLQVAREEASHFQLIQAYLHDLGFEYGDFPAHNGLWEMAEDTAHDVMIRMALVPRVMEARGLDVTPGIIKKFASVGDTRMQEILAVIFRDEIGHVQIGNRWFHHFCEQRGLEPLATFRELATQYLKTQIRLPFSHEARLQAGFTEAEMQFLHDFASSPFL